jgi:hypothetical protein
MSQCLILALFLLEEGEKKEEREIAMEEEGFPGAGPALFAVHRLQL